MRKLAQILVLALLATTLAVVVGSPAQAACPELWDGKWITNDGMNMETRFNQDGKDVKGSYTHPGDANGDGDVYDGTASGTDCKVLNASFKGGGMRGVMRLKIDDTGTHFDGWYKICRFICIGATKYPWTGNHV